MLSSQMMFDKPAGPQPPLQPTQRGRRDRKPRRNRADSIPRHGATDPEDRYYGAGASYIGKQIEIFGGGSSHKERGAELGEKHGNSGDAFWGIYDDEPARAKAVTQPTKSKTGEEPYWDIYSDSPAYSGPSYRDLRVKKGATGSNPKSYQMRRSAPIDAAFDMVSEYKTSSSSGNPSSGVSGMPHGDLQSSEVQKTVRPDGGLGFSRWGESQRSNEKPMFLGEDPQNHGY
eukprot:CAMPEP_0114511964 /NCGR_PEP_ID=MMETSP0109-20121206/14699_1 /TAXON_ID=29199 /ORGANISM="Chlorarachnion reptans, Strain CCCM449" /LENGTH=229 /DNA_ID=CAMNT_0001691569 /DNA_START=62 /DNA_END=751 /DNA_ORIENTATION=-